MIQLQQSACPNYSEVGEGLQILLSEVNHRISFVAVFHNESRAVADPGFPVGGWWTTEVVAYQKFCMLKRKNLDPWGHARRTPPLYIR